MPKKIMTMPAQLTEMLNNEVRDKFSICTVPCKDDTLIITDNEEYAVKQINVGYAVLLYDTSNRFISGVKYVTYNLRDCDAEYLNMVFCRQKGFPLTIITTKRTIIREMTLQDVPLLYDLYDDDEIREYIEPLYPIDKELEYSKSYIENMYGMYGFGLWLVYNKENKELIGRAGLSIRELDGESHPELGYIIRKEYRRQGYGTEVSRAILKYGFIEYKMEDILIVTEKRNLPSCRFAVKLGAKLLTETLINGCKYMIFQCKE